MADPEQTLPERLTERECEIVVLIATGLTNQQIADQLHLTLDTVKWYNRQTYQKLGVNNRTQAVAVARALGLFGECTPSTPHNLPAWGTVFYGRKEELGTIRTRLAAPECRLLTLLGPGGIGKTRLAVEAARRVTDNFADGVCLVQYAPVESSTLILQTLSDALGIPLADDRELIDQVATHLRGKQILLILDNFEHLLDGVDLLRELLDRSESSKLLVTSRERLRLQEEWIVDVHGLSYPETEEGNGAGVDPLAYEAGQLFLSTAQRADAGFVPDESDHTEIARICRYIGGMPLGIELAASWVRLLSCAEIGQGIARNLDLLTTAWRNVPERHRSLEAVLDHSWNLLEAHEQEVFSKLTVFSGPFSHDAADLVAGATLSQLLALADKSFLQRDDRDRFVIHELVKQFGRSKLRTDAENWSQTWRRHCHYHATFLHDRMVISEPRRHLEQAEEIIDDIQTAWRYAVENQQTKEIQRLSAGFLAYFRLRSWYRASADALALYGQALLCFDLDTCDPDERATLSQLYESIGELHSLVSAYAKALVAYQDARRSTSENEYVRGGRLCGKIADVWVAMNRHELGHEWYITAESTLGASPERSDGWWREWHRIQMQRMELYYWQNRPEEMADLAERIRTSVEERGSATEHGRYMHLLGVMALRRERYYHSSDACFYARRALDLVRESGNLREIASRHFYVGFSHLWSDQFGVAETHLQKARKMTERSGDCALLCRAMAYLTVLNRRRNDPASVREYAAQSLRISEDAKMPQYIGMARAHFAWLAWRDGNPVETVRHAQAAINEWEGSADVRAQVPLRWFALFPLLGVALEEEDIEKAVQWAHQMITPPQQRLPDELTTLMQAAVEDGAAARWEAANDRLCQAFQLAQDLHYV